MRLACSVPLDVHRLVHHCREGRGVTPLLPSGGAFQSTPASTWRVALRHASDGPVLRIEARLIARLSTHAAAPEQAPVKRSSLGAGAGAGIRHATHAARRHSARRARRAPPRPRTRANGSEQRRQRRRRPAAAPARTPYGRPRQSRTSGTHPALLRPAARPAARREEACCAAQARATATAAAATAPRHSHRARLMQRRVWRRREAAARRMAAHACRRWAKVTRRTPHQGTCGHWAPARLPSECRHPWRCRLARARPPGKAGWRRCT